MYNDILVLSCMVDTFLLDKTLRVRLRLFGSLRWPPRPQLSDRKLSFWYAVSMAMFTKFTTTLTVYTTVWQGCFENNFSASLALALLFFLSFFLPHFSLSLNVWESFCLCNFFQSVPCCWTNSIAAAESNMYQNYPPALYGSQESYNSSCRKQIARPGRRCSDCAVGLQSFGRVVASLNGMY